jgi:creatinine deaminase
MRRCVSNSRDLLEYIRQRKARDIGRLVRQCAAPKAAIDSILTEDALARIIERKYMTRDLDHHAMLQIAIAEARQGLAEGGIPIGAALFDRQGNLLGRGHNRRVQEDDPSAHGETDAFRKAGRQRHYRDTIMVTTLAPCWYCSGLVRQFRIGTVVAGESVNFSGGIGWLRENGVEVIDLNSPECVRMLADYIAANPNIWHEDIGEV